MTDKTNPSYYEKGGMECRDAIRAATSNLTGEEAYSVGCAIKYLWRFKEKDGVNDIKKARQYLDFLIESYVDAELSPPVDTKARMEWIRRAEDRTRQGTAVANAPD